MKVRTSNWQKCGPEAVEGQKQVPEEATVLKIRTRRLHFRRKQKSWWEGGSRRIQNLRTQNARRTEWRSKQKRNLEMQGLGEN